jgi:hypothetical protein
MLFILSPAVGVDKKKVPFKHCKNAVILGMHSLQVLLLRY